MVVDGGRPHAGSAGDARYGVAKGGVVKVAVVNVKNGENRVELLVGDEHRWG